MAEATHLVAGAVMEVGIGLLGDWTVLSVDGQGTLPENVLQVMVAAVEDSLRDPDSVVVVAVGIALEIVMVAIAIWMIDMMVDAMQIETVEDVTAIQVTGTQLVGIALQVIVMVAQTVTPRMDMARTRDMTGMEAQEEAVTGMGAGGLHVMKEEATGTGLVRMIAPAEDAHHLMSATDYSSLLTLACF